MVEVKLDKGVRGVRSIWVRQVIESTLKLEKKKGAQVSVFLTGNKEIRRINKRHLGHDYATDVISFWMENEYLAESESKYLGDLAVSVEMAKNTAKELKISFKEELARYLVHGTLHLLGYDDKKPKDRKKMHTKQENILTRITKA